MASNAREGRKARNRRSFDGHGPWSEECHRIPTLSIRAARVRRGRRRCEDLKANRLHGDPLRPVHVRDFYIRFENERTQDVNTRAWLGASQCTRAIGLRGKRRDMDRIRLKYEPIGRGWRRALIRGPGR